jgi:predicted Zn finger-like uncharacterized protein
MSMVTRCPHCTTLFRVTPRDLQASQGQVRCGRCMQVFDGFKGLATLPEVLPHPPASAAAQTAPPAPGAENAAAATAAAFDAAAAASPEAGGEVAAPDDTGGQAATAPARDSPPPAAVPSEPPLETPPDAPPAPIEALAAAPAAPPRQRGARAWAAGSILLALALALQAIYLYRTELAARYPALKPLLAAACELAGCRVPLPQRPKLVNIEASDLQALDPARPGLIQLTATLRNHAGYDLAYPALDLVLTNTRDHTLARRIFLPEEYLGDARRAAAGIPASAEVTVRLDLDTGDLGAAGFRLDLLPAPPR